VPVPPDRITGRIEGDLAFMGKHYSVLGAA
jgi:hypothetical protein